MNFSRYQPVLQSVGFSEKEARVYLSCLESGISPASDIAKVAKMNRVTAYGVLQKLFEKGFIKSYERSGVQNFEALAPKEVFELLNKNFQKFEKIAPQLEQLAGTNEYRPGVRFLEGIEGVKKAYLETLKTDGEILSIANSHHLRSHWADYDKEYVEKRAEKKIFLRGVAPADNGGINVKKEDNQYYRETRLIDPQIFCAEEVENEINIFGNKVLIVSFEPDIFAIIIDSPAVAGTQKQIFEMLWRFSKS